MIYYFRWSFCRSFRTFLQRHLHLLTVYDLHFSKEIYCNSNIFVISYLRKRFIKSLRAHYGYYFSWRWSVFFFLPPHFSSASSPQKTQSVWTAFCLSFLPSHQFSFFNFLSFLGLFNFFSLKLPNEDSKAKKWCYGNTNIADTHRDSCCLCTHLLMEGL